MPKLPPVPLDSQLCFALYGASMAINRAYKPLLDQMGITYPQFLVLAALWEADGATIGAVAERLDLEPSTITPLMKRLEAGGFVTRKRDADDERVVRARLTEKGWAMREETTCLAETLLARSGLDVADIGTLNKAVRRLRDSVAGSV